MEKQRKTIQTWPITALCIQIPVSEIEGRVQDIPIILLSLQSPLTGWHVVIHRLQPMLMCLPAMSCRCIYR